MFYFALILIYFTEYRFLNNGRINRFKKTATKFCISVCKFVIWHDINGEKHIHRGYRFFEAWNTSKNKHFDPHRKHAVNKTNLIS